MCFVMPLEVRTPVFKTDVRTECRRGKDRIKRRKLYEIELKELLGKIFQSKNREQKDSHKILKATEIQVKTQQQKQLTYKSVNNVDDDDNNTSSSVK